MHLYDWPLVFVLAGLALYVVLGGADFGAGFWQLFAGRGEEAEEIRDHAHESMAPVWEANHVWLIFVLTVMWTAYPVALASMASTLSVALFIAGIGIIMRGAAYAMRAGTSSRRELRAIDTVFGVSSLLAPFALGAAVGGIASLRVPRGNAAGNLVTSWLNPTSITIGVLAVASAAYVASVYLAADAMRLGHAQLVEPFRRRAVGAGLVTGALAAIGIVVLRFDAHRLFDRLLTTGDAASVVVSAVAGAATLLLVVARRFETARYTAALAVVAIIVGWAVAQNPLLLSDMTVRQAAASRSTLVAVVVAIIAGGVVLFPSLALLFRLVLRGRLGAGPSAEEATVARPAEPARPRLAMRLAIACAIAGGGLLTVADAAWAHALGATALLGLVVAGVAAFRPEAVASSS
jgi:cytochrome bd ubiquinol oxidase subunit II